MSLTRLSPLDCEPAVRVGVGVVLMPVAGTRGVVASLASTPPLLGRMHELAHQVQKEAECFFDCYNCGKLDA